MSEFKSSSFRNEDGSAAPDIVGVTTFTSPYYFVPPSGTTAERPSGDGLAPGMLRFNTDIGRLEVWRGDHWATILGESPNLGNQLVSNSAGGTGTRGLFHIGYDGSRLDTVEYITISTLGNAQDFGNLTVDRSGSGSCSSITRALFGSGMGPNASAANTNIIDFFTIPSTGNATDFGDRTVTGRDLCGFSNQTRGCFAGGQPGTDVIDYVTIASQGTPAQDFGNLTVARAGLSGSCASSTRGIAAGGTGLSNVIDYVTIATTGDAQDFGDLIDNRQTIAGHSNATRGVFGGGDNPAASNLIDFITIASTGNAQDFGDLTSTRFALLSTSSSIRGVFGGGYTNVAVNTLDYITIASTGNAVDFGELITPGWTGSGCSNAHGGL